MPEKYAYGAPSVGRAPKAAFSFEITSFVWQQAKPQIYF